MGGRGRGVKGEICMCERKGKGCHLPPLALKYFSGGSCTVILTQKLQQLLKGLLAGNSESHYWHSIVYPGERKPATPSKWIVTLKLLLGLLRGSPNVGCLCVYNIPL